MYQIRKFEGFLKNTNGFTKETLRGEFGQISVINILADTYKMQKWVVRDVYIL